LEAVRQTKRDTWRFARRQLNWFSAEPQVRWIPKPPTAPAALEDLLAALTEH